MMPIYIRFNARVITREPLLLSMPNIVSRHLRRLSRLSYHAETTCVDITLFENMRVIAPHDAIVIIVLPLLLCAIPHADAEYARNIGYAPPRHTARERHCKMTGFNC